MAIISFQSTFNLWIFLKSGQNVVPPHKHPITTRLSPCVGLPTGTLPSTISSPTLHVFSRLKSKFFPSLSRHKEEKTKLQLDKKAQFPENASCLPHIYPPTRPLPPTTSFLTLYVVLSLKPKLFHSLSPNKKEKTKLHFKSRTQFRRLQTYKFDLEKLCM
jgi:hypothetical protein